MNKKVVLFHSVLLFMVSFISLKAVILGLKWIFALIAGIDVHIDVYTLVGANPPASKVWTVFNVRIFYGIELFILLTSAITFYYMTFKRIPKNGFQTQVFFWFFITSVWLLFGSVCSGILTRTESYHFFNWLYFSYSVMLILLLGFGVIFMVLMLYFKEFSISFLSTSLDSESYLNYFFCFFKITFLPVFIGIIILYIPFLGNLTTFQIVEVTSLLLLTTTGFLNLWRNKEFGCIETLNHRNYTLFSVTAFLYVIVIVVSYMF